MMHAVKLISIVAGVVVLVPALILVTLWISSFPIWQSQSADCEFRQISNLQYKNMLEQAKRQPWTVWPYLSNGLFWPSDRGLRPPSSIFEKSIGKQLQDAISELAGKNPTGEVELSSAHAVMRSIGANLVNSSEVPPFPKMGRIHPTVNFRYFLPQRRFAPLCLVCLIWRYTTIIISFDHDLAAATYQLDGVTTLFGDLKYDPDPVKERNVSSACPAFPTADLACCMAKS
jgi:hypothetical protein